MSSKVLEALTLPFRVLLRKAKFPDEPIVKGQLVAGTNVTITTKENDDIEVSVGNGTGDSVGIMLNDKYLSGVKSKIESDELVHVPADYEYNCFVLDIEGDMDVEGTVNIIDDSCCGDSVTDINQLTDEDNLLFSGDYDDLTNKPVIPAGMPAGTVLGSILANNASNEFVETGNLTVGSSITAHVSIVTVPAFPNNVRLGGSNMTFQSGGSLNVAIGLSALMSLTNANDNTAIGSSALRLLTGGSRNTAVGKDSARLATTAEYNTSIGVESLRGVTTGRYNVAIGYRCFYNRGTAWSGVAIGADAGYNDTTNSKLHIAMSATKSLIEGDFANDWVKIKDWIYILGLTANRLIVTDNDKKLVSLADGSNGQVLTTNGAGSYSWTDKGDFTQIQSDWSQADAGEVDYIKNKPTIPTDVSHLDDILNLLKTNQCKHLGVEFPLTKAEFQDPLPELVMIGNPDWYVHLEQDRKYHVEVDILIGSISQGTDVQFELVGDDNWTDKNFIVDISPNLMFQVPLIYNGLISPYQMGATPITVKGMDNGHLYQRLRYSGIIEATDAYGDFYILGRIANDDSGDYAINILPQSYIKVTEC